MKQPRPWTVDFETFGITPRPDYPPKPVGVSIKQWGKKPRYYSWGHPEKNNCTLTQAKAALKKIWNNSEGLLFQNGKFDVDVADVHMGLSIPKWDKIHDTMFLLFLDDPHQIKLDLKSSAHRLLNLPPDEQDDVRDWLLDNQPIPGVKLSKSEKSDNYWGAYIAYAPGDLVGRYANGDTDRTEKLFKFLWPETRDRDMLVAYDRERKLMLHLLDMERQGIPTAHNRLKQDVKKYCAWRDKINDWVIKRLKADPEINLDSGAQLMSAMIEANKVDEGELLLTATGKYQTNKGALLHAVTDKVLLGVLKYRAQLNTCLNTFMIPWLETSNKSGGFIFTTWNQVKNPHKDGNVGARTGRLSSTPNFQNIPNVFDNIFYHHDPKSKPKLPKSPWDDLPNLPKVRSYVVPFKGHVFIDRDYCFGPGTEVLTKRGFIEFSELKVGEDLVAQWDSGKITYEIPNDYQAIHYEGNLVNIVGERSTDLLVTPNHQCLLERSKQTIFIRADEYPCGSGYKQIHGGLYLGKFKIEESALHFIAALQADATVKSSSIAWGLKKKRKITRLHNILNSLDIPYWVTKPKSKPGFEVTYVKLENIPDWCNNLIELSTKTFSRSILEAAPHLRLSFLRELAWWDGRRQMINGVEKNWSYFNTNQANTDLIQEMATITGLRAGSNTSTLKSGKLFTSVNMRTNYLTWTQTYKVSNVKYNGPVYCVTMPKGTVIVRRNGRVMVTGNSQQEPRILAHFDGGDLMDRYNEEPWTDFHDFAKTELEKVGKFYERKPVKNINLGLIYGMGVPLLAEKNGMPVDETKVLKTAIMALYPGLKEMYKEMKVRARNNEPIRTWGGREYYCEPPKLIKGRIRTFDYKMVNVLIQGSAADCTKEAIIRFCEVKKKTWLVVLNVHDQITVSVPRAEWKQAMPVLKECMEGVSFDVPLLTEGTVSKTNWDELVDYDKKGKVVNSKAA